MAHGELTAKTARYLGQNIEMDGYTVLFDHGNLSTDPPDQVGNISSWFGEEYSSLSQLALLDIAIIESETDRAIALFEIEESSSTPKVILGDAFGTLLGDNITFKGQKPLVVGEFTSLIILIKQSKGNHRDKIEYLRSQIESISKHINSGNASIGRIYIDTYLGELDLLQKAKDQALKCLADQTR
jgi:hypothetical protein